MAQITIYLDDEAVARVKKAAKAEKKSVSKWVAGKIDEQPERAWSEEFLSLRGAFKDFPLAEEIRANHGADSPREKL